ncbi:hypothetical protein [Pseudomonas sp. 5P_5.1_Bac1]|uniref:hypothetical protein n=1 Tax=Pseudomonas sp. 5P_5.1_Bac1 TaxID=2971616 RepID=UPI0021C67265|nr:hypothetical protein [Pseudomonas sp. 5P_5.1_Bac1]MCU1722450.1 hypothetical protein [Pseudomonas sp. 5P_5.1_Bac1]
MDGSFYQDREPNDIEKEIKNLSQKWAEQTQPGEHFRFDAFTEALELHNNGIEPHLLTTDQLITYGVESGKKLLFGNMGAYISQDNQLFWRYCSSLLLDFHHAKPPHPIRENSDLFRLFQACMANMLTERGNPLPLTAQSFLADRAEPMLCASYLFYPLIESLSRVILKDYMQPNGDITRAFQVGPVAYAPPDQGKGKTKCSNLKHSLAFAVEQIENPKLKAGVTELLDSLKRFTTNNGGIDLLFSMRNDALHSGASLAPIAGFSATLSCLLGIEIAKNNIDAYRKRICPIPLFGINMWASLYAQICKFPRGSAKCPLPDQVQ